MKFVAYLEPLEAASGALRVLPGSHHLADSALGHLYSLDVDVPDVPGQVLITEPGDVIAFDPHLVREAAMNAVIPEQMRVGLDRPEIVDGNDVDVLAAGFIDGAHDIAADAAKSVDGNSDGHIHSP